ENAIRDTERSIIERATAPTIAAPSAGNAPVAATPWPGQGYVLATLVTRNIRMMLAKDPLGYLWLFLAPALTIAAVLGSKLRKFYFAESDRRNTEARKNVSLQYSPICVDCRWHRSTRGQSV